MMVHEPPIRSMKAFGFMMNYQGLDYTVLEYVIRELETYERKGRSGQIPAIKSLREFTGLPLKASKEIVDIIQAKRKESKERGLH